MVRDALADALVGPGGVVMLLVFGQDGAQVRLVQDQGPVEELTAQGADEALADPPVAATTFASRRSDAAYLVGRVR